MIRSRLAIAALPVFACLAAGWPEALARGDDPPARVTTDTLEYCAHLQNLVAARAMESVEIRRLMAEGRRQCDHGDVRGGITRLRRALVMLHGMARPVPVMAPR